MPVAGSRFAPAGRRLLAAVGMLALAAAGGCSEEESGPPAEAPVRPAKLVTAAAPETERTVELPAVVEARASAELAFRMPGVLASVPVREGERVAAGAEIARLDRHDLQTALAEAQANHDAAEGEFRRARQLVRAGTISRAAYDQRKSRRDAAAAALAAAQKRFDDGVLRSPFAGLVAALHVEAFQNIQAGQAVATLQTAGSVEAAVQVPATLLAHVNRAAPPKTSMVLDAAPGTAIPAEFRSIATRADPVKQTFEARFAFAPPDDLVILPGMTGFVRAVLSVAGEGRALVPLEAVLSEGARRYVWAVDLASMTVSKREVVLGGGIGAMLPVVDGLAPGETVVAAGVSYLHDGMRIRRYEP